MFLCGKIIESEETKGRTVGHLGYHSECLALGVEMSTEVLERSVGAAAAILYVI